MFSKDKKEVYETPKERYVSLNDYLLAQEAKRKYESNLRLLLRTGKTAVKKTFGSVIKETTSDEPKRQEGSNVLRLIRHEDELKKQFGRKN